MASKIIQIGVVGVDSGQLIMCDPCYIESEFLHNPPVPKPPSEFMGSFREIYRHKKDKSLWQYQAVPDNKLGIKSFSSYEYVIPEYGKTINQLRQEKIFVDSGIDPASDIPDGEFSYRGICKATLMDKDGCGQLNYNLGHSGVGVAFCTGWGDGEYPVYAKIVNGRVAKVWVEFM